MSILAYPVLFNNIDLSSISGLSVLRTDPFKPAIREVVLADIARSHKATVTGAFYKKKIITVGVYINRATRDLTEQSLDSLLGILQGIEKTLVFNQSGGQRKYYATYKDYEIVQSGGSTLELDLLFECSERFGYDMNASLLLSFTGYTSANRSDRLTFDGSAPWQVPVIIITYTAVSGGTAKTVRIGNSDTGQEVAITHDYIAGDVIAIDAYNQSVKVNGVETDFVGAIPEWQKGFGYWYYADNFTTSRSFNGLLTCVRRWV